MKKTIKNLPLLIGTVALATLPITSTISCSKSSNSSNDNNGSGGDTNKPSNPSNPANKQEILNHTNTFSYEPTLSDPFLDYYDIVLLKNFDSWKTKILNNQVKFFNEDGTPIKYEINVHFNAGMKITFKEFNVDPTKPPVVDLNDPWGPDKLANNYKTINSAIDMKIEFYKKENNNSFGYTDFSYNSLVEANNSPCEDAFPLDKNVAIAQVDGTSLDNSTIDRILYQGIAWNGDDIKLNMITDKKPKNWNEIKGKFNHVDSTSNNLMIIGEFNEEQYPNTTFWGAIDVVGTVSVSEKK